MRSAVLILVLLFCVVVSCDWFDDPLKVNLPPDTRLIDCPSGDISGGDDVVFRLSGTDADGEIAAYEWSYDGGSWVMTVADSVRLEQVTPGDHVFRARSIDEDGDVDPSPAECTFNAAQQGELVDRVVLVEILTATWCLYCPNAEQALHELMDEFGFGNLCVIAYHDTPELDELATEETVSRINWYTEDPEFPMEPGARPTVVFDGIRFSQGAETVEQAKTEYRFEIGTRRQKGSPISLRIEGNLGPAEGSLTVTAKVEDQLPAGPVVLRFAVIEDDVFSFGRSSNWFDFVVRDLPDSEVLDLTDIGDSTVVERQIAIDDSWELDNLDVVVFAQDTVEKEVIQSVRLRVE